MKTQQQIQEMLTNAETALNYYESKLTTIKVEKTTHLWLTAVVCTQTLKEVLK